MMMRRQLPVWTAVLMLMGCSRLVGGAPQLPFDQTPGRMTPPGVDAGQIMLDTGQMRGITGGGENLTVIPTMDATAPVDIGPLAETVPVECRFVYAETVIFGSETSQFRKTTFQYPGKGALISEGAAVYPDAVTARRVFDTLVTTVSHCAAGRAGAVLVGDWDADEQSLQTRSGRCGSSYRVRAAVLLEVTYCGFPQSVSEIVLTNLAANVPG